MAKNIRGPFSESVKKRIRKSMARQPSLKIKLVSHTIRPVLSYEVILLSERCLNPVRNYHFQHRNVITFKINFTPNAGLKISTP